MRHGSSIAVRYWQAQLVLWPLYGAIHYAATLPTITGDERLEVAGLKALHAAIGLVVSAPVPVLCRRMLTHDVRPPLIAAALVFASYLLGVFWMLIERITQTAIMTASIGALSIRWAGLPPAVDAASVLVLLASGLIYVAVWYLNEASRHQEATLEQAVATHKARLQAMTLQLSPHFMLNTLATLRSVIAEDPVKAREMVTQLARFTRITLAATEMLTVRDELALIDAYLAIQRIRFEQDLSVQIETDAAADNCLVPALLLQPLVENAVLHGSADEKGVRHVRVAVRHAGDRLSIDVSNRGRISQDAVGSSGLGTRNTRDRLQHVYGAGQDVAFSEESGWVFVRIIISQPLYAS